MKKMMSLVISLLLWAPLAFSQEFPDTINISVKPGESNTIHGISITIVQVEQKNTNEFPTTIQLLLSGPDTKEEVKLNIEAERKINIDVNIHSINLPRILMDNVQLGFHIVFQNNKFTLLVDARTQSSVLNFKDEPSSQDIYVSSLNPIILNDYLQISIIERALPDASQTALVWQVKNLKTGQLDSMNLVSNINRTFDRFNLTVVVVWKDTKTARIKVEAEQYYPPIGKDTLIQRSIQTYGDDTIEKLLKRLGEQYNFQTVWVPEGNEEAVQFVKQQDLRDTNGQQMRYEVSSGSTIEKALDYFFSAKASLFNWTWIDAHHLRIDTSPTIATIENEHKQREEEIEIERQQQEEAQRIRDAAEKIRKDNQESMEQFQRLFQLETQVYPLQTITPITAKLLVDSHLNYFFSIEEGFKAQLPDMIGEIYHGNDHYFVASASPKMMRGLKDAGNNLKTGESESAAIITINSEQFVREEAIADEKGNVLIVTAIPKTHEKITEVLKQVDQQTGIEKSKSIQQYKIEIILIAGSTQNDATHTAAQSVENVELLRKYGIEEIDVRLLDIRSLKELSKSIIPLTGEKGEIGTAKVSLSDDYSCELSFLDLREPYLVVRGTLNHRTIDFHPSQPTDPAALPEAKREEKEKVLLQNTLFLEKDKPTLLGVTNLNEALIMILRYVE